MSDDKITLPTGVKVSAEDITDDVLHDLAEAIGAPVQRPTKPEEPVRSDKDQLRDFFFRKNEYKIGPKCTCGQFAVGPGEHDDHCPRYRRND